MDAGAGKPPSGRRILKNERVSMYLLKAPCVLDGEAVSIEPDNHRLREQI